MIEMGSRIRGNPDRVFECFCEVVVPTNSEESAWILQKFPDSFNNEEVLKSIPQFSYPCHFNSDAVQHFSFVFTSLDSKWTFGFCRHAPNSPVCFVLLSYLPWHDTFFKLLNHIADQTNKQGGDAIKFLEALYKTEVPSPGMLLHVAYNQGQSEFVVQCPDHHKLPSIPENRNLMEYFSAVSTNNMITIFASMLHERRILMTSRKLSKLSACVQAANLLIYPMYWQHIFIPVLPNNLLDILNAPMPFLIGVPAATMPRVRLSEIGDIVLLDVDNDQVKTPFDDLNSMPVELIHSLKRNLKTQTNLLGDTVARAYLRALVQLIGGYKDALVVNPGEKITFNREAFLHSRTGPIQPFLEKILHLQIFQQFIEGRLHMLNSGHVVSDEFESELNLYEDKSSSRFKVQYREWASNMKKEGGAMLKAVKNKANPAVKHAYKSVKHRGRKAVKEIRSKIQEMQHSKDDQSLPSRRNQKPHSAPASPTHGHRPFTVAYNIDLMHKSQTTAQNLESNTARARHYNLLEVSETSSQNASDSDSSPSLSLDQLNLDLVSEMEDLFKQKYPLSSSSHSISSSLTLPATTNSLNSNSLKEEITAPPVNRRLKPARSLERGTVAVSAHPVLPIPPPRSKRRSLVGPESQDADSEAPLIRLDSNDEPVFDPLLQKEDTSSAFSPNSNPFLSTVPQTNPVYFGPPFMPARSQNILNPFLPAKTLPSEQPLLSSSNSNNTREVNLLREYGLSLAPSRVSLLSQSTNPSTSSANTTTSKDPFADLVTWQASQVNTTSKTSANSTTSTWQFTS